MKFQTPPGMRDFYPEDMRLQNWLFGLWRDVSRQAGFVEYEGPIFEFTELYEAKSGAEITNQLFHFEDRGGRRFAIRPELTPTLARMVAARANALPRPIKWFSIPRMCRAERPQRGRLREFFQWNVDILGVEDPLADAEVIATAVAFLQRVGLTADEVVVNISSRALAGAVLGSLGVPADKLNAAFTLLDRADKLPADKLAEAWMQDIGAGAAANEVQQALQAATRHDALQMVRNAASTGVSAIDGANVDGANLAEQFESLWNHLDHFGVSAYCAFDLRTVRGLAYYTGPVFEVRTRNVDLRALFGGGRYDNLTEVLGGPRVTGVGFGAGDAPMFECLRELGKLPADGVPETLDVFVIDADSDLFDDLLRIVGRLRESGLQADFSYKRQAVGKQLKQASQRNARVAVIVGGELRERGEVQVKDLAKGEQQAVKVDDVGATVRGLL